MIDQILNCLVLAIPFGGCEITRESMPIHYQDSIATYKNLFENNEYSWDNDSTLSDYYTDEVGSHFTSKIHLNKSGHIARRIRYADQSDSILDSTTYFYENGKMIETRRFWASSSATGFYTSEKYFYANGLLDSSNYQRVPDEIDYKKYFYSDTGSLIRVYGYTKDAVSSSVWEHVKTYEYFSPDSIRIKYFNISISRTDSSYSTMHLEKNRVVRISRYYSMFNKNPDEVASFIYASDANGISRKMRIKRNKLSPLPVSVDPMGRNSKTWMLMGSDMRFIFSGE